MSYFPQDSLTNIFQMRFLKEHLQANVYHWADEPAFTGDPSRRLFNRHNGDQMLFIINYYASLIKEFSINDGLQIEDMLINQLPLEAKSEISVVKWLSEKPLVTS